MRLPNHEGITMEPAASARGFLMKSRRVPSNHFEGFSCLLCVSFFISFVSFIVLALHDVSSLRIHFRPFTDVLRKILESLTRRRFWQVQLLSRSPSLPAVYQKVISGHSPGYCTELS